MKIRIVALLTMLGAAAVWTVACSAGQPEIGCLLGRQTWAARYYPKNPVQAGQAADAGCIYFNGTNSASGTSPTPFLVGDTIGIQKYGVSNQGAFDGSVTVLDNNGKQSLATATMAIGTEDLGSVQAGNGPDGFAGHSAYSVGNVTIEPDKDGFCYAATLSPAEYDTPAQDVVKDDAGTIITPAVPETDISYTWSNVKFISTTTAPGTQLTADLTYKERLSGCKVDYSVLALWPAIACASNDDCVTVPTTLPDGGILPVSGINPNFPVKCDLDLGQCMLAGGLAAGIPQLLDGGVK